MSQQPRENVKKKVVEFARQHFPQEACGFIAETPGKRFVVLDCPNVHRTPLSDFRTRGEDWERAEAQGKIVCVWHSHPNARADATVADKTCAEDLETPFLIYALPAETWDYYEPSGWIHPLTGRPFVHGLLDCFALVRDFYRTQLGIMLPNYARRDNWWHEGANILMENFQAAGFERVESLQKYDGVLMSTSNGVVNHCGVYLGDSLMLHHPPHRPSCHVPYNPFSSAYYVRNTVAYVRHKDAPK